MAAPGHQPIRNTDRRVRREGATPETAPVIPTSKPTLPSYQRARRRLAARPKGRISEVHTAGEAADIQTLLLDVAAASFGGSTASADATVFEVVLGEDDRMKVAAERMAMNPWRQICALRIVSQSNRTYVGTGWFISPTVLATAGHCVFLQDDGGWARSIRVMPAKHGPSQPFPTMTSTRFASVDGWVDQRKRDFDYGVIFLDDGSPGTQLGNFAVQALTPSQLKGTDAQISGYPQDRDRAEFQYFHMRPMIDVSDSRLVYDIDTFGGQSGSPIWQDTLEHGVIAVGIHTTGGLTSNSGTRITGDVLDNLLGWTE